MVNHNYIDALKNLSCTPTINNGGITMETIKLTDRQVEINQELKELREKETMLNAEYEAETAKARADLKAQERYIKYRAFINAGFNEQQAFAMLGEED